ncbi:serine hydrolase domain-containing protein [Chitinophaga sancti]|uniref:CubicO group peptidase, beta-lactamase class C family n=1 Tax=Chitinophaga sancti TaxID=1004 RepID=A0A1K1R6W4_9BACT|nr:serine hydrolase domain-containing protein [Chitinophaga sancti]WQD64221.1 serine hydrolase domain-containing protein [Chitinophaga sancti]WQG90155.1 serine hydrolase domain-containing protein [Chitinophaga sancti]SFW67366.1 CubicO group peptidase, beta-lactamase class C family [Chitinophaga sancti]
MISTFMHYVFLMMLTSIGIIAVPQLYAQTDAAQNSRIDKLATEMLYKKQTVGITILLLKNGKPVYNKAFGYADPKKKIEMRTDHIFRIASQTKAVTSLAALMLWEEGKFLLDDPVSRYIPEFKNIQVLDRFNPVDSSYTTLPMEREITVRDLFRHTSGIAYPVFSGNPTINAIYAKAGIASGIGSKGELKTKIQLLAEQPLVHQPGTAFTYGLNDDVLGRLIEIWSGVSLDDFFRNRIFEPLEMKDTYFHLPKEKASRLVALSIKDKEGIFRNVNTSIYEGNDPDYPLADNIYLSGGAGLVSTTSDYGKFLTLFLNNGYAGGKRLIGAKTLELMLTNQLSEDIKRPVSLQFGLGVALITKENKYMQSPGVGTFYWGGIFNTHYWVDKEQNLIGLVYTQEYDAYSEDIGHLFKNVIYSTLNE